MIAFAAAWPSSNLRAGEVDYLGDVKSIFKARCFACHGALKQESSLRLDTGEFIRQGGDSGPAVVPGNVDESLLIDRVSAEDESERMPPEGEPLTAAQIELIKEWISTGALSPVDEQPEEDSREHWAFQVPVRVDPPAAAGRHRQLNPVDAFVSRQHRQNGLAPAPPARKHHLLRRVYLDLVGLPPTADELNAFLADDSPDAYERVVDRLLDSSQHAERWARHWMDVWRYSDWYGRRMVPDVWNSAPQLWRWRDWIVQSLNEDKGYDRMLVEMLAADEVAPADYAAGVATGYLVRNWYALNPNDWMRSNVEHTGKAFLGLTFNCAHCHDHKYDPILQEDYFRLRAFFEPIGVRQDRMPDQPDPGPFQEYQYSTLRKIQRLGSVRVYDRNPDVPTWFYTGGDERNRDKQRGSIPPGVPEFLGSLTSPIQTVELPTDAWYPGLRNEIQRTVLAERRAAVKQAQADLAAATQSTEEQLPSLSQPLAKIEGDYQNAAATASNQSGALSGQQSLVLDATTGRRIVQNSVQQLERVEDGTTLRFELKIVRDAHFNFQLAKDSVKGLTAGYLAFDHGRIVAYQPGTTAVFDVGAYDFAGGENRFDVQVTLRPSSDDCLVSIRSVPSGDVLVEDAAMALGGWNPVGDPTKAISFDARPGSLAVVDDVTVSSPGSANPLVQFDFESPSYTIGGDPVGTHGWSSSTFSQSPATSVVSTLVETPELAELTAQLQAARKALEACQLLSQAATAKLEASQAELKSAQARITADQAKYANTGNGSLEGLIKDAITSEREAKLKTAEARVVQSRRLLAVAEAKPTSDKSREKELKTASKQLADATSALTKTRDESNMPDSYTAFSPTYPNTSTGRRAALAGWITSDNNPLTARVAINHIWLRHFHAPLVATVFDFGRNGADPTHPELLDWLAVELMESGWSMKHIHRLIVTSQTYRMASSVPASARPNHSQAGPINAPSIDPENKLLWRMNVGRMESEVVRDSLLHAAGRLELLLGGQELENAESLTTRRRSLYYSCHPENSGKSEFGRLFDAPDATECYRRTRSVIPQQALALTNSNLIHELSLALADSLGQSVESIADDSSFISTAYQQILSRTPTDAEMSLCSEFLAKQTREKTEADAKTAARRARGGLVRALFNHNDFITIR